MRYFKIGKTKERHDILKLVRLLKPYVNEKTIIVNCSPDYSSFIAQRVIHSYYDNPLEMICFDMPFPGKELNYNKNCSLLAKSLNTENNYIFIDSGVLRGKNFETLSLELQLSNKGLKYVFASLYVQDDSIFTPDVYIEKFNKAKQGMLLFWWENIRCTLFN